MNESQLVAALRSAGCVFAEEEAHLLLEEASSPAELMTWTARRMAGEPLEHIVGWASFGGPAHRRRPGGVRPAQTQRAPGRGRSPGHCCGRGRPLLWQRGARRSPGRAPAWAEVYAADSDPAAVACARRNLPPERVFAGDLYAALPDDLRGRVDVLVVNAPYVPHDQVATMPREARDHEHRIALDGGPDGLDVQRRVVAEAPDLAAPGRPAPGRDEPGTGRAHGRAVLIRRPRPLGGDRRRDRRHRGRRSQLSDVRLAPLVAGRCRISADPAGSGRMTR